jgi:hypothetical protein
VPWSLEFPLFDASNEHDHPCGLASSTGELAPRWRASLTPISGEAIDYLGSPRYPHLVRIEGKPDTLSEIIKARASQ